ncbi:MAG: recombinase family protein, partial [Chloroflexota bacterium]
MPIERAIALAFDKCLELGSLRQCLLWLREHALDVPVNRNHRGDVRWKAPSYAWVHMVVTNPVYAGAYAYGRTVRRAVLVDGKPRHKVLRRPRSEWMVLLRDHHEAYIDWDGFERVQELMAKNSQRRRATKSGAAKKGAALLTGLLRCRRCGCKLNVAYSGESSSIHRYTCDRRNVDRGDAPCINFAGAELDIAVERAVLDVARPAAVEAALRAATDVSGTHA